MKNRQIKKFKKKHWIAILILSLAVIVPTVVFGLERVSDFYKPKPNEFYSTSNKLIKQEDLLYTGSHVGVIRGAKTGTIPMGSTPLLRSANNSSLGYAFYKPSELRSLASSLNGNPDYVINHPDMPTDIYKTVDGSGRETWVWARDLGRATGATVDIEQTNEKDESGLPRLRVIFNTSKYPTAAFTNNEGKTPTKVKTGERFYAFVAAEEFDPYQEKISWELTMNGKKLDSAAGSANRSVRNVPIIVNEAGTYTLTLTVTDGIERKTVLNHTITATKEDPPPGPDPEPEPEPENLPPIVNISGPTTVMAGELFCLRANASDPDGTVEDYQWDYSGNGTLTDSIGCNLWFPYENESESLKTVSVMVTDDKGATAFDDHQIKVLPPYPTAGIKLSGALKENRRVQGESTSYSPAFYPINWSKSYFVISSLDGGNDEKIRVLLNNNVEKHGLSKFFNESKFESLYKKEGKYKVQLYIENTLGFSDSTETIFEVERDLEPIADFSAVTKVYREEVKGTEKETSKATIKVDDASSSSDDSIGKRIWTVTYDSNNDGNFEDESPQVISEANLKTISFKTSKVGKYKIELELYETFEQPTINRFVDLSFDKTKTDRRFHNTSKKSKTEKIIEVDNLAPNVSYDVKEKKKVEIEIQRGSLKITENALEAAINSKLKSKLLENDIAVDIVYKDAILDRIHDNYRFETIKTGVTVGRPYNYDGIFEPRVATQLSNGNYAIAGRQWRGNASTNTVGAVTILDQELNTVITKEEADLFGYTDTNIAETSDGKFMTVPGMWFGNQNVHMWSYDLADYKDHNIFQDTTTYHPNIEQIVPVGQNKFIFVTNRALGLYEYKNNTFIKLHILDYPDYQGKNYLLNAQSNTRIIGNQLILEKFYSSPWGGGDEIKLISYRIDVSKSNTISLTQQGVADSSYNGSDLVFSKSGKYMALYYSYYNEYLSNRVVIYRLSDMKAIKTIEQGRDYGIERGNIEAIRDNEFYIGTKYRDFYGYDRVEYHVFNAETGETVKRTLTNNEFQEYLFTDNLLKLSDSDLFLSQSHTTNNNIKNSNFTVVQFGYFNRINIEQNYDDHFSILFDESTITNDAGNVLKKELGNVDSHLLAYSKSDNKKILENVISSNDNKGRYYDSSKSLDSSLNEMADYIIASFSNESMDVDFTLVKGDTEYTESQLRTKFNQVVLPQLNEHNIKLNLLDLKTSYSKLTNPSITSFELPVLASARIDEVAASENGRWFAVRAYYARTLTSQALIFDSETNTSVEIDTQKGSGGVTMLYPTIDGDVLYYYSQDAKSSSWPKMRIMSHEFSTGKNSIIYESNLDEGVLCATDERISSLLAIDNNLYLTCSGRNLIRQFNLETKSSSLFATQDGLDIILAEKNYAKDKMLIQQNTTYYTLDLKSKKFTPMPGRTGTHFDISWKTGTSIAFGDKYIGSDSTHDLVVTKDGKETLILKDRPFWDVSGVAMAQNSETVAWIEKETATQSTLKLKNLYGDDQTIRKIFSSSTVEYLQMSRVGDRLVWYSDKKIYVAPIVSPAYFDIDKRGKNHFLGVVNEQNITEEQEKAILYTIMKKDFKFISMSTAANKNIFDRLIQLTKQGRAFGYNNQRTRDQNLTSYMNEVADYIITEIDKKRGIQELLITTDEEIEYVTQYSDFEKDPHFKDRWKYDHEPTAFENDLGQDSRHMREMELPITQFAKVGRYQPFYSAKDDPLKGIFQDVVTPFFEPYRKWAKDADDWHIYVHRKPIPEFIFKVDKTTRAYTITNQAYDLDKHSIDIGYGPGLRDQSFSWRIQGETSWNKGIPQSPLSLGVYEIKNTVTDFQNKTESKVKILDATGFNAAPIPLFEIESLILPRTTVKPIDLSYDPNGDPIVGYKWQMKKKSEPDTAFKDIANSANKKAPNILFNTVGQYVIRLKVQDQPGLWSAPPNEWHYEEVEVFSPNSPPVAGFNITPEKFIGETIDITSIATDPDGDALIYEYTVKPPGTRAAFTIKTGQIYVDRNGKSIIVAVNGNVQIPTYDKTDVGTWTVTQKVTDPMGASASAGPKQAIVKDLAITGYVDHTADWKKIHDKKGNLPNEFYSGEKFVLSADVASRPIRSVTVQATGQLESNSRFLGNAILARKSDILFIGEYFENRFAEVGTQIRTGSDVEFTFTVIYENGTANGYTATDKVIIKIIGSGLGMLDYHQRY